MWLIGTLCVLAGAEMVFRDRESYIASEFLRQYRRLYERFYDSDVMIDLAFLLLVLLSWLFVWAAASKWLSAAVRSMLCVVGCSVSLYVMVHNEALCEKTPASFRESSVCRTV